MWNSAPGTFRKFKRLWRCFPEPLDQGERAAFWGFKLGHLVEGVVHAALEVLRLRGENRTGEEGFGGVHNELSFIVECFQEGVVGRDQAFLVDVPGEANPTPLEVGKIVVGAVEVAVEQAGKVLAQEGDRHLAAATLVGVKESQEGIAETPHLPTLAIHLPSGFIAMQDALYCEGMCDAIIDRFHPVRYSVEDAQNAGRSQGNAEHLRRIDGQLAMGHPQTDTQWRQTRSQSGAGLDRRTMKRLGIMNHTLTMRTEGLAVFSMRHHPEYWRISSI